MANRHDRSTADLVVLILTGIVGFVVVAGVVGAVVWRIVDPDADIAALAARVGNITNTLVGAIVGYIAGKGAAAMVTTQPPSDPVQLYPDPDHPEDPEGTV